MISHRSPPYRSIICKKTERYVSLSGPSTHALMIGSDGFRNLTLKPQYPAATAALLLAVAAGL
jgi:hypothetical protein